MSRILFDTSAYSAFMRGLPEAVRAIQEADEIFLCPIVLGELLAGFIIGSKEKENRQELDGLLGSPRVGLLDLDEETSERYAFIFAMLRKQGTPIPTNDIWIAACAMRHGLKIVTSDTHFRQIPQVLTEILA